MDEQYYKKVVLVRKPKQSRTWTNRTTKTIEKWCNKHGKLCIFSEKGQRCKQTRKEEYQLKKRTITNTEIPSSNVCRVCKTEKDSNCFYKDPITKKGIANICKSCKKMKDRTRHDSWDALIKLQWRTCLRAHGNSDGVNKISYEDCVQLLKAQNYKCNHCKTELTSKQGTVSNTMWNRASLDRVNTNITGYNNNAQWLCVSCNKGKCCTSDEIHKEKFLWRDRRIAKLEKALCEVLKILNKHT